MSNSIKVTCGQCVNFIDTKHTVFSEDDGDCNVWRERLKENHSIITNSQFYLNELGGIAFNSDIPRSCSKFNSKYRLKQGNK